MNDSTSNQWNVPLQPNESIYPFNNVHRSRGGHLHEIDDTLGAERIHRQHKNGSYETYHTNGRSLHIIGDDYSVILHDKNIQVGGNVIINVTGNCEMIVEKDYNLRVGGNMNVTVDGEVTNRVGGGVKNDILGDCASNISGNYINITHGAAEIKYMSGETVLVNGDSKKITTGNSQSIINGKNGIISSGVSSYISEDTLSFQCSSFQLGSSGEAVIFSNAGTNITGSDLTIEKNTLAQGKITSEDDVYVDDISLKTHRHLHGEPLVSQPVAS